MTSERQRPRACFLMAALAAAFMFTAPLRPASATQPQSAAASHDIELDQHGRLGGRLVDAQGAPLAEQLVVLATAALPEMVTRTATDGTFAFENLRGGTYQLSCNGQARLCRLWSPGTSPPRATRAILLIGNDRIVRGSEVIFPTLRGLRKTGIAFGLLGVGVGIAELADKERARPAS